MKAIMQTDDLKRLIKSTAKFISKDDNRPQLQYIHLDFNKENQTVQACGVDGYRISVENAKCQVDESFICYIKPYLPVKAQCKFSIVELIDDRCFIDIDGKSVGYRQPKGDYLNVTEVLKGFEDTPVSFKVAMNYEYLLDALNSICKDKYFKEPIKLELRDSIGPATIKTKNGLRGVLPCRDRNG